ncbi:uncharacterized protein [Euwallacea fornicatus]|uniref:uncharacterized protein n=1 Tax=Euwallacea fornicatus TaxID=995702 RepID=UPI0033902F5D
MSKTNITLDNLINDFNNYRIQTIIIESVLGGIIIILICCTVYFFIWRRNLMKLVKILDPVSAYKRVGPSIYVKRGQRDTASISSSFKHYEGSNSGFDDNCAEREQRNNRNMETLDRNFFTKSNFGFDGDNNSRNTENQANSTRRRNEQAEAMEAITTLDKVLY